MAGEVDNGLTSYIIAEIAIQVAACDMAQGYGPRADRAFPADFLERATRIIMGDMNGGREQRLRHDSMQTARHVYAHLKQLGYIDDRQVKAREAHGYDDKPPRR